MKTIPFFFIIIFSSSLFSGTLERELFVVQDDQAGCGNGGDSCGGDSLQCMQQLMPCRPYLKESHPPATCCIPLKQAVADKPQCLCRVFQNQDLMRSFNVTLDDAMALAKSCGTHADLSVCKKVAAPSNSPVIPSPPSLPKGSSSPPVPTSDIAELSPRLGAFMVTLIMAVPSLY